MGRASGALSALQRFTVRLGCRPQQVLAPLLGPLSSMTLKTRSPGPRQSQPQRPVPGHTIPEGSSWRREEKQGDPPSLHGPQSRIQSQPLSCGFSGTWPGLSLLKRKMDKNKRAPPCTHSWPRGATCEATRPTAHSTRAMRNKQQRKNNY